MLGKGKRHYMTVCASDDVKLAILRIAGREDRSISQVLEKVLRKGLLYMGELGVEVIPEGGIEEAEE
jgi:hypothetical protein